MNKRKRIFIKVIILSLLILSYKYLNVYNDINYNKRNITNEVNKIYETPSYNNENYLKEHTRILRESAAECTLFLNNNEEFPIKTPTTVLLLGWGARNTIKGGKGSGDVDCKFTTCEEGLENAGFTITTKEWLDKKEYSFLEEKKNLNQIELFMF